MAFDTQIGSTMNVSKVLAKQNEYIKEHAVRGAGVKSTSVTLKEETSSGNYYNFNVTLDDGSSEVSGVIFCPKGMTGSTGATGAKGAQGEQGEQGVSVTDVALQIVSSSVEKTKYRIKTTLSNGNEVLTGTFDVYKGEKGVYINNVDTPTENEITFPHTNLLDDSGIKIGSTVLFNNCKVGVVKSREIGNPILIKCDIIFDFTPTGILICDSPVEQFVTGAELPIDEVWEHRQYVKRGSIIYSSDLTKAASIVSKTDTTYKLGTVKSLVAQTVSNFQFPTTINDEHSIRCGSEEDFTIINQGYYSRVESNLSYSGIQTLSTYINIDETSKAFIVPKEGTKYSGFVGVNICPTENTTGSSLRYCNGNINVRVVNETGDRSYICTVKQSQGYISEIETPALPAGKYSFELDLIIGYGIRTGSVMFSFDVIPFISLQEIK